MQFLLELVPTLALGLLLGRRWPHLPTRLAPYLVNWGVPFSITGLLLRAELNWHYGQVALLALLAVCFGMAVVRCCFRGSAEQLAAVWGNTSYFGIPAVLALLPAQGVGYAISYDLAATLCGWCLGPLLLAGKQLNPKVLLLALLASPASRGLLGASVIQFTPWHELLASWLWWPARVVVLLSLLLLGMRLAQRNAIHVPRRLWAVLGVKLTLFPLALLVFCLLLSRTPLALPQLAVAAMVLQAGAPTAVAVLLLAEASPERSAAKVQSAAGLVLVSTLLALITVPLWSVLLAVLG